MTSLVVLSGVGKQYPGGSQAALGAWVSGRRADRPWALMPLELEIAAGQSIAVLGRNGSGKSTLLGITAGTVAPTVGTVRRAVDPTLLFTVGTSFDEELSGAENTRLELLLRGFNGRSLQGRLAEARAFAEIEDAWEEPIRTYSSGMRARTALAAALVDPGPLLLIDEILSVGDIGFVAKCIDHFQSLRRGGASLLFVSHDATLAHKLADEALVLDHGRLVHRGTIAEAMATYERTMSASVPAPSWLGAGSRES